jgi:hypothetical protein
MSIEKNFESFFKFYGLGDMLNNYLSPEELNVLLQQMEDDFPEVVTRVELGKTYEDRDIPCY